MKDVYPHSGEGHPSRYLRGFDFRYCNREANGLNDRDRAVRALEGIMGNRLMCRDSFTRVAP